MLKGCERLQRASSIRWTLCLALVGVASWGGLALGGQSSSTSFVLQQSTLNTSGDRIESATFRLTASLGQEMTVGTSSSNTRVLQSGFWSFVGSGIVPVLLTVDRNPVTPSNVDLSWSGNNPPYDVFAGADCTDIFSSFLTSTAGNDLSNITPPAATLVCFRVLATAPGPAPPPSTP